MLKWGFFDLIIDYKTFEYLIKDIDKDEYQMLDLLGDFGLFWDLERKRNNKFLKYKYYAFFK